MRLSEFQFELPEDRIAQRPADERDASRLLVVRREGEGDSDGETIEHARFRDLARFLEPGDLLVRNDSRVLPARLAASLETGGRLEALFVRPAPAEEPAGAAEAGSATESDSSQDPAPGREGNAWIVLIRPSKRMRPGRAVLFANGAVTARAVAPAGEGEWVLAFDEGEDVLALLHAHGRMPLPPYIKRDADDTDVARYQTVYADHGGSVAAPTAGLHFTDEVFDDLRARGVAIESLTLHVGPGTFRPIRTENIEEHTIEAEAYSIPKRTADAVNAARLAGRRVLAVGTTTVRTLEGAAQGGTIAPGHGWTDAYIYPGFEPAIVSGMITNFHLPDSSLFLLVCGLFGTERMKRVYTEAIAREYRFYSYGDAMLVL
ncbi:MAG: tRNA preQ1(34) S-adenosylmethionine ribosyltransferase-isomerase QueA [Gemmatimonadetes bacterium]|nr:tRNA preQ1(34) S-adenosylmethionine ribosyltransferase-isomerase QueA [Gemmatimonadota bacterium]